MCVDTSEKYFLDFMVIIDNLRIIFLRRRKIKKEDVFRESYRITELDVLPVYAINQIR